MASICLNVCILIWDSPKSNSLRKLLLILTLFAFYDANGQWQQCVDSVKANPLFQCNDPAYIPVCGCNHITYRNQCEAYNVGGVNNWTSGVCSGVDVDILPNPVGPASELTINISLPEFVYGNITLQIVDMYGKTYEQKFLNNINKITIQQDVRPLMTGVYFVIVRSSTGYASIQLLSKF